MPGAGQFVAPKPVDDEHALQHAAFHSLGRAHADVSKLADKSFQTDLETLMNRLGQAIDAKHNAAGGGTEPK